MSEPTKFYLCPECRTILDSDEVEANDEWCPACGTRITPDNEVVITNE